MNNLLSPHLSENKLQVLCLRAGVRTEVLAKSLKKNLLLLSLIIFLLPELWSQTPEFKWAKQMGWDGTDYGSSIRTDVHGNVYTMGTYNLTVDFDPGPGWYYLTADDNICFVQKLNPLGEFIWAQSIEEFNVAEMAVDKNSNIYLTGGYQDIFVLKLDSSGNLVWKDAIGSTDFNGGISVDVDNNSNAYATGSLTATTDFDPGPGTDSLNGQAFILALDSSGNFAWAESLTSTWYINPEKIKVDPWKNIIVSGVFSGKVDFDPGADSVFLQSTGTKSDYFILKLDSAGGFKWAKAFCDESSLQGISTAIDSKGNIISYGRFNGTQDFDPGSSSYSLTSNGNDDLFVQKLDSSGNFIWAKSFGGPKDEHIGEITTDTYGNEYMIGSFKETVDFDPGIDTSNMTAVSDYDIFIETLDTAGNFIWSGAAGGNGFQGGYSINVNGNGGILSTGGFESSADFDPGIDTFELSAPGVALNDIFVWKLKQCGSLNTSVTQDDNMLTANASGYEYQWLDCNNNYQPIAGETSQSFVTNTSGNYCVVLSKNGCIDTSDCFQIIMTNIALISSNSLAEYPNPTHDILYVELKKEYPFANVEIRNQMGELLARKEIYSKRVFSLDLRNAVPGFYTIIIQTEQSVMNSKVLKL